MINLQIAEDLEQALPEGALPLLGDKALYERAAEAAVRFANPEQEAELTILLTGDEQVRELNRQYREIDASTDVLSFPAGDIDPDSGNLYLGDLVISLPRALSQAETEGHPAQEELRLLVVHGVLHLLGYDHADEQEQAEMWAAQREILSRLDTDGKTANPDQ